MKLNQFLQSISPDKIQPGTTDISLGEVPQNLRDSIAQIGITHPLILVLVADRYFIVCGHRRWRIAMELNFSTVPVWVLDKSTASTLEEQWCLNLIENRSHRSWSDPEIALILSRLKKSGVAESRLVRHYMPILGMDRSKKVLMDYLSAGEFSLELLKTLHCLKAPLRVFSFLIGWRDSDRKTAHKMISSLQPGVNKLRELLEWIDEISRRDGVPPETIILHDDIQSALQLEETAKRYTKVNAILFSKRFPNLSTLRRELLLTLDKLDLHSKTNIKVDESFEKDELRIELNFLTLEELKSQLEKLNPSAQSEAMKKLIKMMIRFRHR